MALTRGQFLRSLGGSIGNAAAKLGLAAATRVLEGGAAMLEAQPPAETPATAEIPFHREGPATGNRLALTFDDGPMLGVTDRILDELARRQVHATFFMIGERAEAAPDLVRRVAAEGHEIGNHTYTHPRLNQLPDARVKEEIARTQEVLTRLTGHPPRLMRPPYGELRKNQGHLMREAGLQVILWSTDSRDWAPSATPDSVRQVIKYWQCGSIVLFHDHLPVTVEALPVVLDTVADQGLSPCLISELLVL